MDKAWNNLTTQWMVDWIQLECHLKTQNYQGNLMGQSLGLINNLELSKYNKRSKVTLVRQNRKDYKFKLTNKLKLTN